MSQYYPDITADSLTPFRTLVALLNKDPGLLLRSDCPYEPKTLEFLTRYFGKPPEEEYDLEALSDPENLDHELAKLYAGLIRFQNSDRIDPKERVQWAKAMTGILNKIIEMRERVFNLKKYSNFQTRVMTFLETVATPDQRTEFVDMLGEFITSEGK